MKPQKIGIFLILCVVFAANIFANNALYQSSNSIWDFLPKIVGEVNKQKIEKKAFLNFLSKRILPQQLAQLSIKQRKSFAHEQIALYFNQIILYDLAKKAGFSASLKTFKENLESDLAEATEAEKTAFLNHLKSKNMTFDSYCNTFEKDKDELRFAAIDQWMKIKIKQKVKMSDKEIKDFYDKSADIIGVSQILIRISNDKQGKAKAKLKAEEILKKLKNGADFNKIASEVSDSGNRTASLGEFGRGQMVQEFDDVAFSLKKGEISEVFYTPFGFHIIRIDSIKKRPLSPFNDLIKKQITEQLMIMHAQDIMINRLQSVKINYKTKVLFKK